MRWETARAYAEWNRWGQCLSELEAIERIAPQEVRRPAVRALARTMLSTPAPVHGVKAFAQRINAI